MPLNKSLKTTSKKPMTDEQLTQWEASRDLEAELVESVRQMKRGEGTVVHSPVIAARQNSGLSQAQFAQLLGVSVRTLQGWEQGRKQPGAAARAYLVLMRLLHSLEKDLVRMGRVQ